MDRFWNKNQKVLGACLVMLLLVKWLPLLLVFSTAHAAEANLSWTPPTQNTDGSLLTDLASYEIHSGCNQSGAYDTIEIIPAPASSYTILGLPDAGNCYFVAKATNSAGVSSFFSNEATKFMGVLSLPGIVDDTTVTWEESPTCVGCIDFSIVTVSPFVIQDRDNDFTILNNGNSIRLDNNTWLQTDITYTITVNTVVEFTFESSVQGEIQGLGFSSDGVTDRKRIFRLYGTQDWGHSAFFNYIGPGPKAYTIPVGQFFTGNGFRLVLANDDDSNVGANGTFSNIRIYEDLE